MHVVYDTQQHFARTGYHPASSAAQGASKHNEAQPSFGLKLVPRESPDACRFVTRLRADTKAPLQLASGQVVCTKQSHSEEAEDLSDLDYVEMLIAPPDKQDGHHHAEDAKKTQDKREQSPRAEDALMTLQLDENGFILWESVVHGTLVVDAGRWGLKADSPVVLIKSMGVLDHDAFRGRGLVKTADHKGRLFIQNADGTISPKHAPCWVFGAQLASYNTTSQSDTPSCKTQVVLQYLLHFSPKLAPAVHQI